MDFDSPAIISLFSGVLYIHIIHSPITRSGLRGAAVYSLRLIVLGILICICAQANDMGVLFGMLFLWSCRTNANLAFFLNLGLIFVVLRLYTILPVPQLPAWMFWP